jgi:arylsulfatase A-like enzyme
MLLQQKGLWDNCVIIVTTDNGGELPYYDGSGGGSGSNVPFRGGKFGLYEGGIRGPAFVYSPSAALLPVASRGTVWKGLAHSTDLFATIAAELMQARKQLLD